MTTDKQEQKRVQKLQEKSKMQRRNCSSVYGAMKWAGIETQADWNRLLEEVSREYKDGNFFLKWIGRGRELEPELVATLLILRKAWVEEYKVKTPPEFMLLDCAFISYYHLIRINYIIGNTEARIEWEFFASDDPDTKLKEKLGTSAKYKAEDMMREIITVSQPLLDQFNRMFIRNLKALRDLKRGNIMFNIGNVSNMNIADKQQINILAEVIKALPSKTRKQVIKNLDK